MMITFSKKILLFFTTSMIIFNMYPGQVCAAKPANKKTTTVDVKLYDHYSKQPGDGHDYYSFNPAAGGKSWLLDCPEHEKGMVLNNLGIDKLPLLKSSLPCPRDASLEGWFRANPHHNDHQKRVLEFNEKLIFTNIGNDRLHFVDAKFFPLDDVTGTLVDQGYEELTRVQDNSLHNMGFTLHISSTFTYFEKNAKSMDITFTGGDDFWVFIDGKLVIDFGGIHNRSAPKITLKQKIDEGILNLQDGRTYSVDLFYAKRHTHNTNFNLKIHKWFLEPVVKKLSYQIIK